MRAVIDTSSLLALVRYYLPFDNNKSLRKYIKKLIDTGEIIILDKVYEESKYTSKGIILTELNFLKDKQFKTNDILPNPKFFNQLENQFCYGSQRNRLDASEFELAKKKYLNSADAKLLLYCMRDKDSLELDLPILVTEETKAENDNKLFKKLPEICSILEIGHCSLPLLFRDYLKISISKYLTE
ncbi:MAG: hypothetical protein A2046_05550 [Bacteroidetes bacterium GWA2_30_7]|nr:MAG: hypothetical protein A2046_05550 [Bacteroidetes bacterium GWA2_30_7]